MTTLVIVDVQIAVLFRRLALRAHPERAVWMRQLRRATGGADMKRLAWQQRVHGFRYERAIACAWLYRPGTDRRK